MIAILKRNVISDIKSQCKKIQKCLKDAFKDGKAARDVDNTVRHAQNTFDEVNVGFTSLRDNNLVKEKNKLLASLVEEEQKIENWTRKDGKDEEVETYKEACQVLKFNFLDIVIWVFFMAEAYICYGLLLDCFSDTSNAELFSFLAAGVISLITIAIKETAYLLPRWFKYIVTFFLVISAIGFIYYVVQLRTPISSKDFITVVNGIETVDKEAVRAAAHNLDNWFQLYLLLCLLFGGLQISFSLRDPHLEHSAKKMKKVYSKSLEIKELIDAYDFLIEYVDVEIIRLNKNGRNGYVMKCITHYIDGLSRCTKKTSIREGRASETKKWIEQLKENK